MKTLCTCGDGHMSARLEMREEKSFFTSRRDSSYQRIDEIRRESLIRNVKISTDAMGEQTSIHVHNKRNVFHLETLDGRSFLMSNFAFYRKKICTKFHFQ